MTPIIAIRGSKGGVGTSTVITMLALSAQRAGKMVLVVADSDINAILGCATNPTGEMENLDGIWSAPEIPDYDEGPATDLSFPVPDASGRMFDLIITADGSEMEVTHRLLVTRGCYLGLRRAVRDEYTYDLHGIILLNEEHRSLGAADVTDVLGAPVLATIEVTPSVSRMIDAGVMRERPDHHAMRRVARLLNDLHVLEAV